MALETIDTEVLVIGAGPAGATAAFQLAAAGHDVVLADRAHFPRAKPCGDGLTNRAFGPLERMGLLAEIRRRYQPCRGVAIIAPDGHRVEFERQPGGDEYGYVIPRTELDELIRRRAEDAGARMFSGLSVRKGSFRDGRLAGVRGRKKDAAGKDAGWVDIKAKITILATGAGSTLPEIMGFPRNFRSQEYVLRAYFDGVKDLDGWEEFYIHQRHSCGYSWIFDMGGGRANVGLGLEPQDADLYGKPFGRAVERMIREDARLEGRFRDAVCTEVWGFPLNAGMRTGPLARPGVLLVGDAAGTTLPINGEGISYAMIGGELAAELAREELKSGLPTWTEYDQRMRQRFEGSGIFYLRLLQLLRFTWTSNTLLHRASKSRWVHARLENALLKDLSVHRPRLRNLARALSPW